MDLAFLFISALAASTILPMSSEVVLGTLARSGSSEVWLLLAVATAGNTLGAVVNWGIGRYASTWRTRLPSLEEAKFERACHWFNAGASGACCSAGCRWWAIRSRSWQARCELHSSPLCYSCRLVKPHDICSSYSW
jgi:hypothetical protein